MIVDHCDPVHARRGFDRLLATIWRNRAGSRSRSTALKLLSFQSGNVRCGSVFAWAGVCHPAAWNCLPIRGCDARHHYVDCARQARLDCGRAPVYRSLCRNCGRTRRNGRLATQRKKDGGTALAFLPPLCCTFSTGPCPNIWRQNGPLPQGSELKRKFQVVRSSACLATLWLLAPRRARNPHSECLSNDYKP
jgi:hypothetical protein